jgi:redox-sensitive bicupin YhaK (pirin superfamily)
MNQKIRQILKSKKTIEGAGVKLKRVFGYNQVPMFDPFLLLDNFGSKNPNDYLKGFPWHPHRGIETVTYILNGEVEHGDSMGNKGTINSGDIQWMSAGSGIIHQEMPQKYPGEMRGFQLWVNLPAKNKMAQPKYRGITKTQIPTTEKDGAKIKLIAGEINGVLGPVKDLVVDVEYFDVSLATGKTFTHNPKADYTTFAFVFEGTTYIDKAAIKAQNCILFSPNMKTIKVEAKEGARFLFVSGKPLNEPVAWGGPIVMNTQQELDQAFQELDEGTFIKTQKS